MENENNGSIINDDSLAQIEKAAGIIQMIKILSENNDNSGNNTEIVKKETKQRHYIQEFDEELQTPALKTIKAAIPYLDFEYQKNLGMFVKIMEINSLMRKYRSVSVTSSDKNGNWQKAMLKDVSEQLEGRNKGIIQMIIKMIDISEIMQSIKNTQQKERKYE
ncbi:MAG: hypothetical protein IJ583_06780 [Firmicutes bacterium]|nr:hypothetical protein [Bacillota bacterium]